MWGLPHSPGRPRGFLSSEVKNMKFIDIMELVYAITLITYGLTKLYDWLIGDLKELEEEVYGEKER